MPETLKPAYHGCTKTGAQPADEGHPKAGGLGSGALGFRVGGLSGLACRFCFYGVSRPRISQEYPELTYRVHRICLGCWISCTHACCDCRFMPRFGGLRL